VVVVVMMMITKSFSSLEERKQNVCIYKEMMMMIMIACAVISAEDVANTKGKLEISVVWDVTLYSLVEVDRRCGGICCPHVVSSQTTAAFIGIVTGVRTSNLIKMKFVVLYVTCLFIFGLFDDAGSSSNYIASNLFKY
jgi:hypothetical protein